MPHRLTAALGFALASTLALGSATAADWPQWQGPDRTAVSKETGLLKTWPKEGPKLAWKSAERGGGYATPSVAGGKVFGMGYRGKEEIVWALDEKTGKELWAQKIAGTVGGVGYGEGPRCTPTVDGERVYALGVDGDLACLEVAGGKVVWQKSLRKDFGGGRPGWGFCESPLIDGDKLICSPGGKNTIVALNKNTGETLWKAAVPGAEGAQYASAIAVEIGGQRQYVQFLQKGIVSVGASDGAFLWRYDAPANGTANAATPVFGGDGLVFAASNYGNGGGLVNVTRSGDKFEAKQEYFDRKMANHHGGMVLIDGYLYGEGNGRLRCIEFKTGKQMWDEGRPGKGSIVYADGHLCYRNEGGKGTLYLIEANPKEYVEKGRFDQPERSGKNAWAHPVIANGKLYVQDQDVLFCYDIAGK